MRSLNNINTLIVTLSIFLVLTACGGGSEDENNDSTPVTGEFIDSAVEGLSYKTETQSGLTDSEGKFIYIPGETVTFSIGDIVLGSAKGEAVITPVSLVTGAEDENNEMVVNIARVLQTLDKDGDPDNGILIDELVRTQAISKAIDFTLSSNDFEDNGDIQTLVSELTSSFGEAKALVSSSNAKLHLKKSILTNFSGIYYGTFSGDDSGKWAVSINKQGSITGKACSSAYPAVTVSGNIATNGSSTFSGTAGIATFTGSVSTSGKFTGTWVNAEGEDGNFTGSKDTAANDCETFEDSNTENTVDLGHLTFEGDTIVVGELFKPTKVYLDRRNYDGQTAVNLGYSRTDNYQWTYNSRAAGIMPFESTAEDGVGIELSINYTVEDNTVPKSYSITIVYNWDHDQAVWSTGGGSEGIEGITFEDGSITIEKLDTTPLSYLNDTATDTLTLNGTLRLTMK